MNDTEPPEDYLDPEWAEADRVHDWRNYIPESLKVRWLELQPETRMVAACMAEMQAHNEQWD